MIQKFFGYNVKHLIDRSPEAFGQGIDRFVPEIEEWCEANLNGGCEPVWVEEPNNPRHYHYEFCFENENDAFLFKLFHIG